MDKLYLDMELKYYYLLSIYILYFSTRFASNNVSQYLNIFHLSVNKRVNSEYYTNFSAEINFNLLREIFLGFT
jgi:hypothetical protein